MPRFLRMYRRLPLGKGFTIIPFPPCWNSQTLSIYLLNVPAYMFVSAMQNQEGLDKSQGCIQPASQLDLGLSFDQQKGDPQTLCVRHSSMERN